MAATHRKTLTVGQLDTLFNMIIEADEYLDPLRVDLVLHVAEEKPDDDVVDVSDEVFDRMRATYAAVIDLHNTLRDTIDSVRS